MWHRRAKLRFVFAGRFVCINAVRDNCQTKVLSAGDATTGGVVRDFVTFFVHDFVHLITVSPLTDDPLDRDLHHVPSSLSSSSTPFLMSNPTAKACLDQGLKINYDLLEATRPCRHSRVQAKRMQLPNHLDCSTNTVVGVGSIRFDGETRSRKACRCHGDHDSAVRHRLIDLIVGKVFAANRAEFFFFHLLLLVGSYQHLLHHLYRHTG